MAENRRQFRAEGYTMIEMLVVVSIIGLLLAIVVPGVSTMWDQQNRAGSETKLKGLLASARVQAIRKGKAGLIFFLDGNNRQQAVFIEPEPVDDSVGSYDLDEGGDLQVTELMAVNRYRVVLGDMHSFPAPYRVAPGWTVEVDSEDEFLWQVEMQQEDFPLQANGSSTPCYHRSFFAILFGSTGEMIVDRNVLIHDPDTDGNNRGDVTGLFVGDTKTYFKKGDVSDSPLDPSVESDADYFLTDMVLIGDAPDYDAANFVSQSLVFVYDDSAFEGLTGIARSDYLLTEGIPFFVTRYTGEVIRGSRRGE